MFYIQCVKCMIEFRLSVASDEHRPIAHRHSVWLWEETKIQHVPICSKVWIPFFPFALVVFKVFSNTDSICCWVLWDVISPTTEHHHSISAQMWAVTQSSLLQLITVKCSISWQSPILNPKRGTSLPSSPWHPNPAALMQRSMPRRKM